MVVRSYTYRGVLDLLLSILAELWLRAASRFLGGCLFIPPAVPPPSWAPGVVLPDLGVPVPSDDSKLVSSLLSSSASSFPFTCNKGPPILNGHSIEWSFYSALPLIKDACLTVTFPWLLSLLSFLPFTCDTQPPKITGQFIKGSSISKTHWSFI